MLRVPAETRNLNERLMKLEEWSSQSRQKSRWWIITRNGSVEDKLTDLSDKSAIKEIKFNELLEANSRESHSRNERLEDKLKA